MGNVLGVCRAPTRIVKPHPMKALAASFALSGLFIVVYGGCNWITGQRANVESIEFAWERHIPFVPLLIPAYMSIDVFFIAAPFLCRSESELSVLTKRIAATILIAGACFLMFPLRFAFERPIATGWSGLLFNWFRTLDAPFNQFPSLHIALCLVLCVTYSQHTRGALRVVVVMWFVLIAASAVLTYQHHVLDVAGGAVLAAVCIYGISARLTAIERSKSSAAEAL